MRITEVCVGQPITVQYRGKDVSTGIFKSPAEDTIKVNLFNLAGDRQADLSVHGGRDKAIYVYPRIHYEYWASELPGRDLETSQFGENLSVADATDESVMIGDRYRVGTAQVIVTQPRLPCFKLGIRMNDQKFPALFLRSGKLGFYLRVEEEGALQRGDEFELIDRPAHNISVLSLWKTVFGRPSDATGARDALHTCRTSMKVGNSGSAVSCLLIHNQTGDTDIRP